MYFWPAERLLTWCSLLLLAANVRVCRESQVNIGQEMRKSCLASRARDASDAVASMDTFNAVSFELLARE